MTHHIFHTAEDFWKTVNDYKVLGYTWIQESHSSYNPNVTEVDMPVLLNVDDEKTLMFGVISAHKEKYFADPKFVKLYTKSLRKKKLEKLNELWKTITKK